MKRRAQIEDSKQRIAKALLALLKENDFAVITLSEIAAIAGVTRMTIHRHFKTKENIILYLAQKSLDAQLAQVSDSPTPLLQLMYLRLEGLKALPHRAILLESKEIEILLAEFRVSSYRDSLKKRIKGELADDPYFFSFYFGGITAIVRSWLEEDCRTPTEQVVQKIANITGYFM